MTNATVSFSPAVFNDENTSGYNAEQIARLNSIVENLAAVSICEDSDDLKNLAERAERIFESESMSVAE